MKQLHNTPASLQSYIARYAESTLFICDSGEKNNYANVLDLSEDASIKETSRRLVFCICENESSSLLGYLSMLCAGAVPLMLGPSLQITQLERLLGAYRPGFIWISQSRSSEILNSRVVFSYRGYCLLATNHDQSYSINDSLALLLSTSGSTGSPKFVRISHENLVNNADAIAQYLKLTPEDRPITTLPPSYTYGLSVIHSHILTGSTIALTNKTFFDRGFWDFLKSVKATSFGGVPYHFEMLKKLRFSSISLPSLRKITQAGGRLAPELSREFAIHCHDRGIKFYTMYGQAEATARMSYLPPETAVEKAGSIGLPIPGGMFWLEDESGQSQDAIGQLVYQGKNVSMGYAESYKDLARGDECGGVLRTGDLARRDSDGYYYIIGRLKRFLKLFGHRVNLQDIEDELKAAGYAAACSGQDDQLEIYISQGSTEAAKLIKLKLVERIKVTPKAIKIYCVTELPRNEAGKIQYSELTPIAENLLA